MSRLILTLAIGALIIGFMIPATISAATSSTDELFAPVFITRPDQLNYSHCETGQFKFQAVSAVTGLPSVFVRYRIVSGPGFIDSVTGEWTLPASFGPGAVGTDTLVLAASEFFLDTEGAQNLTVPINRMSMLPFLRFDDPTISPEMTVVPNHTSRFHFYIVSSYTCDSAWLRVATAGSDFRGQMSIENSKDDGYLTITPDDRDAGQLFDLIVIIKNRYTQISLHIWMTVAPIPPIAVRIGSVRNQIQGAFVNVPATLERQWELEPISGYNFLIAYDNSALSLQNVTPTALYNDCKWEYFTYRFGANGDCSAGCPAGLVRVVGLAETNNGIDKHPVCFNPPSVPEELFSMSFLITNNRTYECQHTPIQFFWIDCSDNLIAGQEGRNLLIASRVFNRDDSDKADVEVDSSLAKFPGYAGIPAGACFDPNLPPTKSNPRRYLDFYNGSINIICPEVIDGRGDINLNSINYEVADFVMLENYFLQGTGALGNHVAGSTAASDVNADGVPLEISDLDYIVKVINGDAVPYPIVWTNPQQYSTIHISEVGGVISQNSSGPIGALFVIVQDTVKPELLQAGREFKYAQSGDSTRIVVCPPIYSNTGDIAPGPVIQLSRSTHILYAEASTILGEQLDVVIDEPTDADENGTGLPTQFALHQNYPNPFNAGTVIDFDLPTSADVSLDIFNILGQVVWTSSAHYSAGTHKIEWLGNLASGGSASSGVYYYRLTAGSFVESRKMILLK